MSPRPEPCGEGPWRGAMPVGLSALFSKVVFAALSVIFKSHRQVAYTREE